MPWHPDLESAAVPGGLGRPVADVPTEAVWRTVLRRQAVEAELLRAEEVPDSARGELVKLLVWTVAAGIHTSQKAPGHVLAAHLAVGGVDAFQVGVRRPAPRFGLQELGPLVSTDR